MASADNDKIVAHKFEAILTGLGASLPVERRPVIGDIAYLYVRCARFRSLMDDLLSKKPTRELRDSLQQDLYTILAEIENIHSITTDLKDGLERVVEELPGDVNEE